ncbi:MAG: rhodanese-like domain-containing protein [Gammaproteobacteria bacterium]
MFDILSCSEIKTLLSQGGQLIDVRSHYEFSAGALNDAVHMPLDQMQYHVDAIEKDKPVILYCRSGQRSAFAKQMLEMMGFRDVYNIGGYSQYASC